MEEAVDTSRQAGQENQLSKLIASASFRIRISGGVLFIVGMASKIAGGPANLDMPGLVTAGLLAMGLGVGMQLGAAWLARRLRKRGL